MPQVRWTIALFAPAIIHKPPITGGEENGKEYKSRLGGCGTPVKLVDSDQSLRLIASLSWGTSSKDVNSVDHVPPESAPLTLKAEIDLSMLASGPAKAFNVLLARYTMMSEGTESKPDAGIMIACVLDAM